MRCTAQFLIIAAAASSVLAGPRAGDGPPVKAPQKVVIPFDFESKFDGGRYGRVIGEMIWKKLEKQGGFVLPETMDDVRAVCERKKAFPTPNTPLTRVKVLVKEDQAGDIGIWGKVERVAGFDTDVYDLWISVADFSVQPPRLLYEKKKVRTKTVSEIPHVYIKEALDRLYDRKPAEVKVDPQFDVRWTKAPNLVKGTFENGRAAPEGWDPLPRHVTWLKDASGPSLNRYIRFTIPPDVAESTGVLYYSAYFPVEAGATYRFQCRWRTTGPAVKVFVKCYAELQTEFRDSRGAGRTERREVYRSQQNLAGPANTWNTHTEDFTPTHSRYIPRWGRVMLYGYYPAGKVDWDDVIVKQVAPAPSELRK